MKSRSPPQGGHEAILFNADLGATAGTARVLQKGGGNQVAMPRGGQLIPSGQRAKKGYKLMYQVQKVVTVERPSQQMQGQFATVDERDVSQNSSKLHEWDSSTLPISEHTATVPRRQDKARHSRSVKPKQKFRALLPTVLNEPSFDDVGGVVSMRQQRLNAQLSPMSSLKQKAIFSRKKYQQELTRQRQSPNRSILSRKQRQKAKLNQSSNATFIEGESGLTKTQSFNNPQQEARFRRQMLLEKIHRDHSPPLDPKKADLSPRPAVSGKLFILRDRSGSKAQQSQNLSPSERRLFVHPSSMTNKNQLALQSKQLNEVSEAQLRDFKPYDKSHTLPQSPHGQSSVESEDLAREHALQDTGDKIINLTVADSLEAAPRTAQDAAPRGQSLRKLKGDKRRFRPSILDTKGLDPFETFPNSASNVSKHQKSLKQDKKEHARFLVELMSPFNSKAGTQGLMTQSGFSIDRKPVKDHMKPQYRMEKLTPITQAILNRSHRNQTLAHTNYQVKKKRDVSDSRGTQEIEDGDINSSIDTKKSPFRQQLTTDGSQIDASRHDLTTKPRGLLAGGPSTSKTQCNTYIDASSVEVGSVMHLQASQIRKLNDKSSTFLQTADGQRSPRCMGGGTARTSHVKLPATSNVSHRRKFSLNDPSTAHLDDHDRLPYMTINSCHLANKRRSQAPESLTERVKLLPLNVQKEIHETQETQLFQFYEAMLQPSTLPFTSQPDVAHITPKIGDKVSMLGNVRETLTKRYQLALAAKVEARRRLQVIDLIRRLRHFIKSKVYQLPLEGQPDQQVILLQKIAFSEPHLVNEDLWRSLHDVYICQEMARRTAAAYKIQTWVRMALQHNKYKAILRGTISLQRLYRYWKLRKFFREVKMELKKRAVLVLQRQCRGYLTYGKYFARVKGSLTQKNLDYIITRYADAKEFMRECLQVQLAYLTRKMIKRKKIEAEERRKAALAEKKRIAREKELERLRKIHEERKEKKRQVRLMLKEVVQLAYPKEDKRREDTFQKAKKATMGQPNKKITSKWDMPAESYTFAFKQELFEGCYKRINKRIAAAKKKSKPNKDLKNLSAARKESGVLDFGKMTLKRDSAMKHSDSPSHDTRGPGSKLGQSLTPAKQPDIPVALDPHHLQINIQGGRHLKLAKYDKHPNIKLRRNYRDMVALEVTLEVIEKENEKYQDPPVGAESKSNRAESKQSTRRKPLQVQRQETPDMVNISISAPMGLNQNGSGTNAFGQLERRDTLTFVQQAAATLEDIRVASNDDLSIMDDAASDATSNTSHELSINSETYDFMQVIMPLIRPKVEEEDLDEGTDKKSSARIKRSNLSVGVKKGPSTQKSTTNVVVLQRRSSTLVAIAPEPNSDPKTIETKQSEHGAAFGEGASAAKVIDRRNTLVPISNQKFSCQGVTAENRVGNATPDYTKKAAIEPIKEEEQQELFASTSEVGVGHIVKNPLDCPEKVDNDSKLLTKQRLPTESLIESVITSSDRPDNKNNQELSMDNLPTVLEDLSQDQVVNSVVERGLASDGDQKILNQASAAMLSQLTLQTATSGEQKAERMREGRIRYEDSLEGPIHVQIGSSSLASEDEGGEFLTTHKLSSNPSSEIESENRHL